MKKLLIGCLAFVALAAAALATAPPPAHAACAPPAGVGTPPSGTTVTCSGTTTNQNPPNVGYGDGSQNRLTINVQSGATVTGDGGGIGIGAGLAINNNNTVNNSGTISAIASSGGFTQALGILANGSNLTLNNSGTISAIASSGGVTGAVGIFANGTVTNSGTLSAIASGPNSRAVGIEAANNLTVTNSGALLATSSGSGVNSFAVGIEAQNSATITNSGTVSVTSTAPGGPSVAYGIFAQDNLTVTNSGIISATGPGSVGIKAITSTVTNSGTISGNTGIVSDATLINSGTIIGTGGTAIDFSGGSNDSLTFLPGSRIVGRILLGANDSVNVVTGRDIAWLLTFGTAGGANGLAGAAVNVSGGAPFVVKGNQIATLDPTAFALADRTLMDFTGGVSALVNSRLSEMGAPGFAAGGGASVAYAADTGARLPVKALKAAPVAIDRATVVWAKAFGGERSQDADAPDLKAKHVFAGGALGADWAANGALRVGLFAGGGAGRSSVDLSSQTVDQTYEFGGAYGHFDWDARFLDIKLWGGGMQSSSTRLVMNNLAPGGIESANGSYSGAFFTPEIAYGWRVAIGDGVILTPVARARYVAGWFNGYNEAGSAQGLTVGSRTVQDVEERIEVTLAKSGPTPWGQPIEARATFGALGIERVAGQNVAATLIGVPLSFAVPGQNAVAGGYIGTGIDLHINATTSVFTSLEGTIYSDKSRTGTARGGLRARF
jgi:hypothetical protein